MSIDTAGRHSGHVSSLKTSKKRNKSRFSVLTGAAVELLLTVPPLALQVLHHDGGALVPC